MDEWRGKKEKTVSAAISLRSLRKWRIELLSIIDALSNRCIRSGFCLILWAWSNASVVGFRGRTQPSGQHDLTPKIRSFCCLHTRSHYY